ncbi:unnamed protein product, partial [Scytosiphon promiscuus]
QQSVHNIQVSEPLVDYVQRLVTFTRQGNEFAYGLSPRGALALITSAKSWALLHDRTHVVPEDIQAVLPSVVEHRLREAADFTGHGGGALAQQLLGSVDVVETVATSRMMLSQRFASWLDRRIPPGSRIKLSQANIFIFPTRSGFAFVGLLTMLILGAI